MYSLTHLLVLSNIQVTLVVLEKRHPAPNENIDRNLFNMSYDDFSESNITCNLYSQFKRGKSQQVIGYSLYGQKRLYYDKLKNLTSQLKKLYPDWSMRIYYDDSINKSIIASIGSYS